MDSSIAPPPNSLSLDEVKTLLSETSKYRNGDLHKKLRWFRYDLENDVSILYRDLGNNVLHEYKSNKMPKSSVSFSKNKDLNYKNRVFKDGKLVLTELKIPDEKIIATYICKSKKSVDYVKQVVDIQSGTVKDTSVIYAHKEIELESKTLYTLYKRDG